MGAFDDNILEKKMNLDKIRKKVVHFYILAAMLLMCGGLGICLGVWVQFFRNATPSELFINRTLVLYSIGFIISAFVHFSSFRIIKRLVNLLQTRETI